MASKLAWAGLLGEAANIGNTYIKRQQDLEDKKVLAAQEQRREDARFAREKALAEWRMNKEQEFAVEKEGRDAVRDASKRAVDDEYKQKEEKRKEAADKRKSAYDRQGLLQLETAKNKLPTDKQKLIEDIEKDPDLTPAEKKAQKAAVRGVTSKASSLSEYQQAKLEDQLAKLEDAGIDETNINQVNRLRDQLGYPKLSKKLKTPAKKGFLGRDTPEEYEFVEGEGDMVGEQKPGLSKYASMLKVAGQDGSIGIAPTDQPAQGEPQPAAGLLGGAAQPAQQQGGIAPTSVAPQAGLVGGQQSGPGGLPPEQMAELDKMTMPQLQAFRQGFMNSDEAQTPEGQKIIQYVNQLIAQKGQLVK